MLRGGGGQTEANELLPSLYAKQDPHGEETQLSAQRRGPGAPRGAQQTGRGTKTHFSPKYISNLQVMPAVRHKRGFCITLNIHQ